MVNLEQFASTRKINEICKAYIFSFVIFQTALSLKICSEEKWSLGEILGDATLTPFNGPPCMTDEPLKMLQNLTWV